MIAAVIVACIAFMFCLLTAYRMGVHKGIDITHQLFMRIDKSVKEMVSREERK